MLEKKELRKEMLGRRDTLDPTQKQKYDTAICEQILDIITIHNYNIIHTYLPMGSEINIFPLIERLLTTGKTVVTPKALKHRKMENLILNSLNELESGIYGTQHPANSIEYTGNFDLFIIPGLAFDRQNYRLGYGSGYYDTFLVSQPQAYKLGIAYPFQIIEKVPTEPHDMVLDQILY
jgi:5-formyltetrahydrofolate cyclo-ligase